MTNSTEELTHTLMQSILPEWIYDLLKWAEVLMREHPLFAIILFSVVFYLILKNRMELQDEIRKIEKLYANRTFSYLEGKLDSISASVYHAMLGDVNKIKLTCPNEKDNCSYPTAGLDKELEIYRLTLRDVFLFPIKNRVKNNILENGYHHFTKEKLSEYCNRNGADIHEWVTLEVGLRGMVFFPNLLQFLGEGLHYSERQAIDAYVEIIDQEMFNENACKEQIKRLKINNLKFWRNNDDI